MSSKAHTELVIPQLARQAMNVTTSRPALFTAYIMAHFHVTGKVAPGCDFKDLIAWFEVNMPLELAAVTRKAK